MDTLKTTLEHEPLQALRQDPALQSLMERLPDPVRDSFTEEQLAALKLALATRSWGRHAIDTGRTRGLGLPGHLAFQIPIEILMRSN